jgi:hypothetical protein
LHIAQNQKPMEGFLIWKTGIWNSARSARFTSNATRIMHDY